MRTLLIWLAAASVAAAQDDKACRSCHEDQVAEWRGSVHDAAKVGCTGCHGTDEIVDGKHKFRPGFRPSRYPQIAADCGVCHAGVLEAFRPSDHGANAVRDPDDPRLRSSCTACHGNHDTAPADRQNILPSCLKCHGKGDQNYLSAASAFEKAGRLDAALKALGARVAELQPRAGIGTADAESALAAGRGTLAELRIAQHGLAFQAVGERAERSSAPAEAAYNSLTSREREFARRGVALVPFLLLLGAGMALVARKGAHR